MSDSVQPHRRQPTRLSRPWNSPGKNTGVGCHFPLQCMKVKIKVKSLSCVQLLATPWTVAHQVPPSMGFSRQEYWSGVPLPSPLLWSATYKNASFLTDLWLECVVKLLSFCQYDRIEIAFHLGFNFSYYEWSLAYFCFYPHSLKICS